MSEIKFDQHTINEIVLKLQNYFDDELNSELGQFEAEFLITFISKELAGYFYNQGLLDARVILDSKLESINEEIYSLEKTID